MSESFKYKSSDFIQPYYQQPQRLRENWMAQNMIYPPHQMFRMAPYNISDTKTNTNITSIPPPPPSTAMQQQYYNDHEYYIPFPSMVHPQYIGVPVESERLPLKNRLHAAPSSLSKAMAHAVSERNSLPPAPSSFAVTPSQLHKQSQSYIPHQNLLSLPTSAQPIPSIFEAEDPTCSAKTPVTSFTTSSATNTAATAVTGAVATAIEDNKTKTTRTYTTPRKYTEKHRRKLDDNWNYMYARLVKYHEEHGHCRVPTCYKQDPSLASWLKNQRNREHTLTEDRKQRLAKIGFYKLRNATPQERTKAAHKSLKDVFDKRFEVMLKRLAAYKKEHGHCNVPNVYKADPQLASWVRNQRSKQKEIPADRKERMEKVGFLWNGARETSNKKWMAMFQRLEKYAQSAGNCSIPEEDFPKLRKWVYRQRFDRSKLSQDRIQRLNSIGFTWSGKFLEGDK